MSARGRDSSVARGRTGHARGEGEGGALARCNSAFGTRPKLLRPVEALVFWSSGEQVRNGSGTCCIACIAWIRLRRSGRLRLPGRRRRSSAVGRGRGHSNSAPALHGRRDGITRRLSVRPTIACSRAAATRATHGCRGAEAHPTSKGGDGSIA